MDSPPHFVLIPLMAQGHIIPMVDIAKLLASRNVTVTIVTTFLNAARIAASIDRAIESGLQIRVMKLRFPATEVGLPEGCESGEVIPSPSLIPNFYAAASMLQEPTEKLLEEQKPRPTCIISDRNLAWTADIASKFLIPRVLFDGTSCFTLLCNHCLQVSKIYETFSESEPFVVPGLPGRIEFTKIQIPGIFNLSSDSEMTKVLRSIRESEIGAYGVLVNSFEELELEYVSEYKKATGNRLWCLGPVSLINTNDLDKAQRGKKSSTENRECLNWLDLWPPGSVIYACLGSLCRLTLDELVELGLGLEASNRPFIWVVRGGLIKEEIDKWLLENEFEERVKERGLLIKGWAPQVLILSHPAIGGFLTHCGWNSTLEGVCAGVPMITWPMFAEQFYNKTLVVKVLGAGVGVGAVRVVNFGEQGKYGVMVRSEQIREAIEKLMCQDKDALDRRVRAKKLAEVAKKALEEGGSSYLDISLFIEDIKQEAINRQLNLKHVD